MLMTHEVVMANIESGEAVLIGYAGVQKSPVYKIANLLWERGIDNQPEECSNLYYSRTLEEALVFPYYQHLKAKIEEAFNAK